VDFGDEPGIQLSGTVRRGDTPLPGATVMFLPADRAVELGSIEMVEADGSGHYEVALDLPGTWQVAVRERHRPLLEPGAPIQLVVPDEPRPIADIVIPTGTISGTVTGDDGAAVAGAAVSARLEGAPEDEWLGSTMAQTDAAGRYALAGVAPGGYRLTVIAPGFRSQTRGATLEGEGLVEGVDFRLERGRAIWGRVVDPHGAPIAQAGVLVAPAGGEPAAAMPGETDRSGAFRVTAPVEGPLDVTVLAGGWAPLRVSGILPPERHDDPGLELRVGPGGGVRVRIVGATGEPLPGLRPVVRPVTPFAGSEYSFLFDPIPPTDTAGESLIQRLAPGAYEVRLAGRQDVAAVLATVLEGAESTVTLRLPAE
jgi:hypothetical protein